MLIIPEREREEKRYKQKIHMCIARGIAHIDVERAQKNNSV